MYPLIHHSIHRLMYRAMVEAIVALRQGKKLLSEDKMKMKREDKDVLFWREKVPSLNIGINIGFYENRIL